MGRLSTTTRLALPALGLLLLSGCESGPPEKTWEEIRAERVKDFMLHLNNDSESERWRDGLIEVGLKSPEDRDFVLLQLRDSYSESMNRGGVGTGVLRTPGRRRVMEVVGGIGKYKEGMALLNRGLNDDPPVVLAAAASLVGLGEIKVVPKLMEAVLALPENHEERAKGLQALRRAAKPANRKVYLNALGNGDLRPLKPVVLASFPEDPDKRLQTLRLVVKKHRNPFAKRFAMEVLMDEDDKEVVPLAKAALRSGDRIMRPTALRALGAVGGNEVAEELESFLRTDPADARAVVRGLYEIGSAEALERATSLLTDPGLKPKTRAAVAREFMGHMKDPDAPGPYQQRSALADAQAALREVLEEGLEQLTLQAVDALSRIGERGTDVDVLQGLLEDPTPSVSRAVVKALGRLGGEHAGVKLVELIASDPDLRMHAATALGQFQTARDVPVAELIDMLEDENEDIRKAAHKGLMGLRKSPDPLGYNPTASERERLRAIDNWRGWWKSRR